MRRSIAAFLLTLVATAAPLAQDTVVTGTLTYRERITLPITAVVDVTLEDVSRADRIDAVVASTRLLGADVDIAFRSAIDRVHSFRVLGRVLDLYDADRQLVARFTAK